MDLGRPALISTGITTHSTKARSSVMTSPLKLESVRSTTSLASDDPSVESRVSAARDPENRIVSWLCGKGR